MNELEDFKQYLSEKIMDKQSPLYYGDILEMIDEYKPTTPPSGKSAEEVFNENSFEVKSDATGSMIRLMSFEQFEKAIHEFAQQKEPKPLTEEILRPEDLPKIFKNIRIAKTMPPVYDFGFIVSEHEKGGDSAEVYYSSEFKEWSIVVDNFPLQRKIYKTSFPMITIHRFKSEMKLVGIELEPTN